MDKDGACENCAKLKALTEWVNAAAALMQQEYYRSLDEKDAELEAEKEKVRLIDDHLNFCIS